MKPSMVHGDFNRKELTKFFGEARIWLNKTITEEEKKEEGMIYASLRSVLYSEWTQIFSRIPNIEEKSFEEIIKLMNISYLEKNPLVVQRIN